MPIYDPTVERMAVRVVYDGVACAGKTTNLRQLSTLFAAKRREELHSPADLRGRTLFFDWMQIDAGVVCGFPLLCQVVSVPGQVVLTPRRKKLLESADVVIYVCESRDEAIEASRVGLELVDRIAKEQGREIALVIQANKQDVSDAFDGAQLLDALDRRNTPVVEAIASEGVGVVDTFVTAVRSVARSVQARSEGDASYRLDVRPVETANEVLDALTKERIDPEWAAEMLLEEVQSALIVDLAPAAEAPAPQIEIEKAVTVVPEKLEARGPLLPSADVPTGFIWPAHTGRAIVRALGLEGHASFFDAEGRIAHLARGTVARTSIRSRFADDEAARQALVRCARECTQLERLLVPETVLVAQSSADGCFIWRVQPDLPSVDDLLATRGAKADLLSAYGVAVVDALRISLRHGFAIDISPKSFGLQHGALRYIGELSSEPNTPERLSASLSIAVSVVERAGADVTSFLESVERECARATTNAATRPNDQRLYAALSRATGVA